MNHKTEHRKLAHQELKGPKSKARYHPLQLDAARAFLRDLLETPPNRFRERLRLCVQIFLPYP